MRLLILSPQTTNYIVLCSTALYFCSGRPGRPTGGLAGPYFAPEVNSKLVRSHLM